jgi:hypothetical protein
MWIRHINNTGVEHDLRFDPNNPVWRTQRGEPFNIAEVIAGKPYFVKRYTNPPTATELIMQLAGRQTEHIPRVYDLAQRPEGQAQKIVYYYITESLPGNTLDNVIKTAGGIAGLNLAQLISDLLGALAEIQQHKFWFSDLNEKNVFCGNNGRFYLIDVDSCWSNTLTPSSDEQKQGGVPGASYTYASIIVELIRSRLGQPLFELPQLTGSALNYLQLLAFVARLAYYKELDRKNPGTFFKDSNDVTVLSESICEADWPLCQLSFQSAIQASNTTNLYADSIFTGRIRLLAEKLTTYVWTGNRPRILFFKADKTAIVRGEAIKAEWQVENATEVLLEGNSPKPQKVSLKGTLSLKADRDTVFTLIATNPTSGAVQRTLPVSVSVPQGEPEIVSFKSSASILKKGETLHVTWIVRNADKVFFDSEPVKARGHKELTAQKSKTFELLANGASKKQVSQQLPVKVNNDTWILRTAIIAIVLILVGIGGYSYWVDYRIEHMDPAKAFDEGKKLEADMQYKEGIKYFNRCVDADYNLGDTYLERGRCRVLSDDITNGCNDLLEAHIKGKPCSEINEIEGVMGSNCQCK